MSSLANIIENACFLLGGAALCYLLLWWKDRNLKKVKLLEAETLIAKAHSETDIIRRAARRAGGTGTPPERARMPHQLAASADYRVGEGPARTKGRPAQTGGSRRSGRARTRRIDAAGSRTIAKAGGPERNGGARGVSEEGRATG